MFAALFLFVVSFSKQSEGAYDIDFEPSPKETNFIFPPEFKPKQPKCVGNSICSFLQANDKGVSVVKYCECSNPLLQCPNRWDQFDGKSISQGQSDQYKYCEQAPTVSKCSYTSQVAYTSWQRYRGDKKIESRDDIVCTCPEGHNYLDTKYDFTMDGKDSIIKIQYFCLPLPPCNSTMYCKDITAKPGEYIVNPKCLCQNGQACPTITDVGVKTTRLGDLTIHNIKCQNPLTAGIPHNIYFHKKNILKRISYSKHKHPWSNSLF